MAASRPGAIRLMRSPSTGRVEVPFSARFHLARSGRNPDGVLVEGLRIGWVGLRCAAAVSELPPGASGVRPSPGDGGGGSRLLVPSPPGVLLDATIGAAGHARALLDAAPHLTLVGLDQDPDAVAAARTVLSASGARARVVQSRFERLAEVLETVGVEHVSAGPVRPDGVSSPQLDRDERGFSYRKDGPLDMRMDPTRGPSAADVVNTWPEGALVKLFRDNGETRFAPRIARAVVAARPLLSTIELASVVRDAIPAAARRTGGHPARRVFQAVRIAVNEELEILPGAIDAALGALVPGGRCAVISYHSGEDRIVKDRLRYATTGGCQCPPGLPCACGAVPTVRLLVRGALRPTEAEVAANRRAESARLRAAVRLPAPDSGPIAESPTGAQP